MATEYDKLVRDDIPDVIREDGKTPVTKRVSGAEYEYRLRQKLVEEAIEFEESADIEELADVLEVIKCYLHNFDFSEDVAEAGSRKRDEKGSFEDGIVLLAVEE